MNLENKVKYESDSQVPQKTVADIFGKFQTVSVAPTKSPVTWADQIKIYTNGGTLRLYWYDTKNNVWHYVTATA